MYSPWLSWLLAWPSSCWRSCTSSAAMSPRVPSDCEPLTACSTRVRTRCSTLVTLPRLWSSRLRRALAAVMLRWYCAVSAIWWPRSSARAAPTGSSDGWVMRLPVLSCWFSVAMLLCRSSMVFRDCCCIQTVETRMGDLLDRLHGGEQGLEQGAGRADDLRRGLVGLLVAHEVGRLLIQVHAGHALLRRHGLVEHGHLGGLVRSGHCAGTADLGDHLAVGAADAGHAAVQYALVGHLAQRQRIAVVTARIGV